MVKVALSSLEIAWGWPYRFVYSTHKTKLMHVNISSDFEQQLTELFAYMEIYATPNQSLNYFGACKAIRRLGEYVMLMMRCYAF